MTQKEIHFYYDLPMYDDDPLYGNYICTTYEGTKRYIDWNIHMIHTTSLSNLSFDLLDKGYRIYLHQNGRVLEAKPGMTSDTRKEIRRAHNILKMWLAGCFSEYFNKDKYPETLKISLE